MGTCLSPRARVDRPLFMVVLLDFTIEYKSPINIS